MIKFKCPNCSHRIGAPDDYAGKKARCSKCKQPVRIPSGQQIAEAPDPDVIKFRCDKCNQKIAIAAIHVGKRVKCKKCENICVVTVAAVAPAPKAISDNMLDDTPLKLAEDYADGEDMFGGGTDLSVLAVGDAVEVERPALPEEPKEPLTDVRRVSLQNEPKPQRKLPWPIDILLYPASVSGILNIIFVVIGNIIAVFGGLLGFLASLLLTLYIYWYCCECIRDSAEGNLRAPNAFNKGFDLLEEFWQYLKVLATCVFFIGPAIIYYVYCGFTETEINRPLFIFMIVYGITFFPMGVLAMVLFDSLQALNPWLLIRSIISTLPQYIGLVILFYGLSIGYYLLIGMITIGAVAATAVTKPNIVETLLGMLMFKIVSGIGFLWLVITLCHLLGRFYYKYEEKLYWEV
ncbi:MAG: DUF4013 domain-containing protein [Planctomycetes bacterium]|nr:DUF4013 domain-containing protein [Planctomycetota bacterium]